MAPARRGREGRQTENRAAREEAIATVAARIDGGDAALISEGLTIARLHRQVDALIEERMAGWGMSARQIDILELLHVTPEGLTPADLSDQVGLSRSAMTGALDALERRGNIRRTQHPTDRRMLGISLTPKGREFIERRLPERLLVLQRVIGALSADERRTLVRAYRKVLDVLREPPDAKPADRSRART